MSSRTLCSPSSSVTECFLSYPAVLKYLLQNKLIDGDIMTVTGKTLAENLEKAEDLPHGQDVLRPLNNPIKKTGHLR